MTRSITLLALILAFAFAVTSSTSFETVQSWGTLIRKAEDVTPERYWRLIQACRLFAVSLLAFSIIAWRNSATFTAFLRNAIFGGHRSQELSSTYEPERSDPAETDQFEINEARRTAEIMESRYSTIRVLMLMVCLIGVGIRLAFLFQPMAYDESYTYINFASRSLPEALGDYNSTNNHLLNTLCVFVTTRLLGPQAWVIRLGAFTCGCLLPYAAMVWAREWVGEFAALLTGAFIAVSPELVTYSDDARGYIYVVLAAIVLDLSLARISRSSASNVLNARSWSAAWVAVVAGLCAMPIMLYSVIASSLWALLMPNNEPVGSDITKLVKRLFSLTILLATACLAVIAFYTPAYIFRGFLFLHDPIVQSKTFSEYISQLESSWRDAFLWWCDGGLPIWLWVALLLVGAWRIGLRGRFWLRWLMPFAVVFTINLIQQFAPPPRIYLQLAPWIYLLAAVGIAGFKPSRPGDSFPMVILVTLAILVAGIYEAASRPVFFFPEERVNYLSVPDVINRLEHAISHSPREANLILAPLPCDLPSLFYMDRMGFRIEMNRVPRDGQDVWLIARGEEKPRDVLKSNLIQLGALADRFDRWQLVERFQTLTLYHAKYRAPKRAGGRP